MAGELAFEVGDGSDHVHRTRARRRCPATRGNVHRHDNAGPDGDHDKSVEPAQHHDVDTDDHDDRPTTPTSEAAPTTTSSERAAEPVAPNQELPDLQLAVWFDKPAYLGHETITAHARVTNAGTVASGGRRASRSAIRH